MSNIVLYLLKLIEVTFLPSTLNVGITHKKMNKSLIVNALSFNPFLQEKLDLSKKVHNATRKVKRLQQKVKTSKLNDDKVIEYMRDKKKFSNDQLELQKMQLRNTSRKPQGRRYMPREKSLCLAMYKTGPRSYRFKEDIMALPALSTLSRHSAKLMFPSGTCPTLFSFMKDKVKNWSKEDLACSFSFDETALKSRVEYNSIMDEINGFVEMAGIRKPVFATHALTFMVRGINKPFKQPVAHFYTHGLKSFELSELILLVLEAVLNTGRYSDVCSVESIF